MLLLYGAKDKLVNTQPSIDRARELNPGIKTIIYADSGHAPFFEEAARFNRDLSGSHGFGTQQELIKSAAPDPFISSTSGRPSY